MRVKGSYEEAAFRMLRGDAKVLRINAIPALPEYGITDKFIRFQEKFPDVQISVSEADSIVIRKELLEHQCDLAIMRGSRSFADAGYVSSRDDMLRRIPICMDELVAVLPAGHPLASEKQINLRQLADDRFVLIKEGSLPYHLCINACKSAGFIPHVEFTSHNREAMLDMVVKGGLTALMFSSHVRPASRWCTGPRTRTLICSGSSPRRPTPPWTPVPISPWACATRPTRIPGFPM